MTVTQSTATSQLRIWPAYISSIVDHLPVFSGESSSTATGHARSKRRIELSSMVRSMLRKALPDKESCIACDEQVRTTKLITAPCGHVYCHHCLCKMAVLALQDMPRFPVRCCSQEIPAVRVGCAMDARGRRLYISRVDELAMPPAERWYCPQTTCGRWIPPKNTEKNSRTKKCPHCRAVICTSCHDFAHGDTECTEDPSLRQLLDIARRKHWQRCYNCHALVVKTEGCNHISCKCGAQFCYICGRKWSRCHCRDSTGLLDYDGQIVGGDLDIATIVAAMDFAEQDVAQVIHYEQWHRGLDPLAERFQEQPQPSRPPGAQPAIHARAAPPARSARTTPARTTPARTTPARTTPARTTPARTTPARTTPAPVRRAHNQGRASYRTKLPRHSNTHGASGATAQVQLDHAEVELNRLEARFNRLEVQLNRAYWPGLDDQQGQR